jgi:hypothetical protein
VARQKKNPKDEKRQTDETEEKEVIIIIGSPSRTGELAVNNHDNSIPVET